MDNLYVVESPLQALCALEISLDKKNESHGVVVRVSSGKRERHDKQILDIINKVEWGFKSIIKCSSYGNVITDKIEDRFYLSDIENEFKDNVKNLYIGEFRSSFMHMCRVAINANSVFLLDDGAVTISVIDRYIINGHFYPYDKFYPKKLFKRLFFSAIYRKYIDLNTMRKEINVLTTFIDTDNKNIKKIDFNNIKELFSGNQIVDNSLIYYYGSKYSEAGIITRDYEICFLRKVKDFYSKNNKEVIYFAHRDESKEKLDYISSQIGFEVIVPSTMAELSLLENKILPSEISGAYTSILNNIKVIFPEIPLRSFKLKPEKINHKWREGTEAVYLYYKNLGIPIEE